MVTHVHSVVQPLCVVAIVMASQWLHFKTTWNDVDGGSIEQRRSTVPAHDPKLFGLLLETNIIDTTLDVMQSWPYKWAFISAVIAGITIQLKHIPIIHVESDRDSPNFNMLSDPVFTWPANCAELKAMPGPNKGGWTSPSVTFLLFVLDQDKVTLMPPHPSPLYIHRHRSIIHPPSIITTHDIHLRRLLHHCHDHPRSPHAPRTGCLHRALK